MNLKETIRAVEEVEDIALTDDNFTQERLTAIEIALSADCVKYLKEHYGIDFSESQYKED